MGVRLGFPRSRHLAYCCRRLNQNTIRIPICELLFSSLIQMAIAVFAVTFCLACKNKESTQRTKQFIPRFSIMDVAGRAVSSKNLEGSYVYVQFLKKRPWPDVMRIEDMFKEILSQADCTSLFIIPDIVPGSAYRPKIRGTYLIIDEDSTLSLKLGAPSCCDSFYIYNRNRELMIQGILMMIFKGRLGRLYPS
jgi:hypothetical protein